MTTTRTNNFSRRDFFKLAGGTLAAAAGAYLLPQSVKKALSPMGMVQAANRPPDLYFASTDGWIYLPPTPAIPPYHPDPLGQDATGKPLNTYIFGFRDVTGLDPTQVAAQKMKAQHIAPLFWVSQETEFHVKLENLGLQIRPDLTDAHTIHWHGFRDAIPFFDGEPHGSLSVPMNKSFTYVYRPHEPGTYMYHCHVEDVEHVHQGMTGLVFVRPASNPKWAYDNPSTAFDREFAFLLTEVWAEAHWADAHIQLPEWSDYHADFGLLNGRVYPDTVAPNAPIDTARYSNILAIQRDANGDLVPPVGHPELQYQPYSSLVTCNAGEKVLLRFANLGFTPQTMTLTGIKMRVVGEDATPKRGRDNTDTSYWTSSISLWSGASYDAIFTAPAYQGPDPYDTYLLYNRSFLRSNKLDPSGYGGQMTEVRVYPAGTLEAQAAPNT